MADLAKEREKRQRLEAILAQAVGIELKDGGGASGRADQISAHADQIASRLSSNEERIAKYEQDLAAERDARWRAEVAAEKGLSTQQAARLRGATREELVADADELVALFPTAPAGPRNPAPDPSQGARGGQPGPDLQAQIAAAKARGDIKTAIALERSKLSAIPRPS
jgi:hypothetical protein